MTSKMNNFPATAPTDFPYFVRCSLSSNIPFKLCKYSNTDGINLIDAASSALYRPGLHNVFGIDFWITDHHKSGFQVYYFHSKEDYTKLCDELKRKENELIVSRKNSVYNFTCNGWTHTGSYSTRTEKDLIGYEEYLTTILKDAENYYKYIKFMKEIGEDSNSLNYLLYGPPGVGKTTLIKVIATKLNSPIYIVRGDVADNVAISHILTPSNSTGNMAIVLFEDFDRYLEKDSTRPTNKMAEILNCLDGVESSSNIIRFFTGNNCDIIKRNEALLSRMNGQFEFYCPTLDNYMSKLRNLLVFHTRNNNPIPEADIESFSVVLQSIIEKQKELGTQLSLRAFTLLVIRYLFEPDCLKRISNKLIDTYITNTEELYILNMLNN